MIKHSDQFYTLWNRSHFRHQDLPESLLELRIWSPQSDSNELSCTLLGKPLSLPKAPLFLIHTKETEMEMTCGVLWATRPNHAWKLLSTVSGNCQVLNKWECLYFLKFNSASKSLWAYKALGLCSTCFLNLEDSVLLYSHLIIIGQSPFLFADRIRSYLPQRPFPDGSSWTPPLTLILAHTLPNTLPDLGPNILSKGNTNNDGPIWSNSSPHWF